MKSPLLALFGIFCCIFFLYFLIFCNFLHFFGTCLHFWGIFVTFWIFGALLEFFWLFLAPLTFFGIFFGNFTNYFALYGIFRTFWPFWQFLALFACSFGFQGRIMWRVYPTIMWRWQWPCDRCWPKRGLNKISWGGYINFLFTDIADSRLIHHWGRFMENYVKLCFFIYLIEIIEMDIYHFIFLQTN